MATAKIFMNGRSQAVRLPKDFRFSDSEVNIRKEGNKVILEPVNDSWDWLDDVAGQMSPDFMKGGRDQPDMPTREDIF